MVCCKCKIKLKKDDSTIMCDSCGRCVHRDCSELNTSELKVIDLKGKRTLKYYCEDCQAGVKLVPKLIKKLSELENVINELKNQEKNSTSEEVIINELSERQRKANNVMFYNLSDNNNLQQDLENVKVINREIAKDDLNVVRVIRMGKRNKNGARPLKIICQTPEEALLVIKNRRNINRDRKVFIEADMTTLQMNNSKKIKDELSMRRNNGEDVFIKYIKGVPQIVKNSKK